MNLTATVISLLIFAVHLPAQLQGGELRQRYREGQEDQLGVVNGRGDSMRGDVAPGLQEALAGKGVLGGKVVNARTKEPIKKAHVQLNGPTNLSAVTDGSGSFTFRALPPGGYMLNANHEDYYLDQSTMNMARPGNPRGWR